MNKLRQQPKEEENELATICSQLKQKELNNEK